LAIAGLAETTEHVLTGDEDRARNMVAFASAALALLAAALEATPS
jgi:hypothetical protein